MYSSVEGEGAVMRLIFTGSRLWDDRKPEKVRRGGRDGGLDERDTVAGS